MSVTVEPGLAIVAPAGLVIDTTGAAPPPVVLAVSVAVTVAAVYPLALAVKVGVPVLLASAVTGTVCGVE